MISTLHLGCGREKQPGAVCADKNPASHADVRCDLDALAFPFASSRFDRIICDHILEHLDDVIHAMDEIHRVAKPGATVRVRVPHFSSIYYYSDPTHKHPFSLHSFDYFLEGTAVREFSYSSALYRILKVRFPPPENAGVLKRGVFEFINRYKYGYEKHLAFVFPRHLIEFELQVVKGLG